MTAGRLRAAGVLLAMAGLLGATLPAGSPSASAAAPTAASAPASCADAKIGARVPILLVHGFHSDASTWDGALTELGADTARSCVDVFDYGLVSTQWVTNPFIGKALAGRILDLAGRSTRHGGPGKVIVVAHSMGGLATRCATDPACGGASSVAGALGDVITYGTPNTGSFLKAGGASLLADALGPTLSGATCVRLWRDVVGYCDTVRALGTSAAAHAFTPGSEQLRQLGNLPGTVPVYAVAGSVRLTTQLFTAQLPLGDAGDLVVDENSAFAASRATAGLGGRLVIDCGSVDLSALVLGLGLAEEQCWHGGEPADPQFTTAAMRQLRAAVDHLSVHPVTLPDLLGAPVPPLCQHAAGHLTGGALPLAHPTDQPDPGYEFIATGTPTLPGTWFWGQDPPWGYTPAPVFADLTGDGVGDAAVVLHCSAGGVSWPDTVLFYGPGPRLLAYTDLESVFEAEHANVTALTLAGHDVQVTWGTTEGCCSNPTRWTARLHYAAGVIQILDPVRTG